MDRTPAKPQPAPIGASWRTRLPFYYGWVVLGSIFATQIIALAVHFSFSVFFVALLEEFGWGRGPTAGAFSIFLLAAGVGGTLGGLLVDRLGPARVVASGSGILAAGLAATSQITELWQFYLSYGLVCGVGMALSGWVVAVILVSRWFFNKRGVAMGIASAGTAACIVVMVPLAQYMISGFGWRTAYLTLAALVLVGVAPQTLLLLVGRPEDLGLKPDGASAAVSPDRRRPGVPGRQLVVIDREWASRPWSVPLALGTTRFWLLVGNLALAVFTSQMVWAHQVAYLVDGGYDRMLAASIAGFTGLLSLPGRVLWGMASDRWGREVAFTLGISTMVLALGTLVLARIVVSPWTVVLFAVTFAVGYATTGPVSPAAAADIFAGPRFGAIFGVIQFGSSLGSSFGAWFAGLIFDLTGSYFAAFGVAAASSATSILLLWLAAPRKVRRMMDKPTR